MSNTVIAYRLKHCREINHKTQEQIGQLCGVHKSTVSRWESGETDKIGLPTLSLLAKLYNVSEAWLSGKDVPMNGVESTATPAPISNVFMRPIYNSAAAGFNVLAQDTITGYMPTYISSPSEQEQYIWVNVVGDSMSPLIENGDMILLRRQESIDSGQIAVVLIDGEEASVKRVIYGDKWIELQSVNPYYPPRRFEGADVQRLRVMGLVKKVSKDIC